MQTALVKILPGIITVAAGGLNQYPSGALTLRHCMPSNERSRKGEIITFARKEHHHTQGQSVANKNYTD